MIFKRILKFTLPAALLLAVGTLAYADGEVTLKGGNTTISWSDFVKALNEPPTVTDATGKISDLPNSNQAKATYNAASQKVTNDITDLAEKRAAVLYDPEATTHPKLVQDSLTAESELATAQSNLENYISNNVTEKKTAYEEAEAQLTTWNADLTRYQGEVTKYTGQVTSYSTQLEQANDVLAEAKAAYDKVGTTTETQTTTIVPWLDKIWEAAKAFNTAYNNGRPTSTAVIYYQYFDKNYTGSEVESGWYDGFEEFNISFVEAEGYSEMSAKDFATFLRASDKPVVYLNVYLGPNYTAGNKGLMNVTTYTGSKVYLLSFAYNAVENLTKTTGYYTTKTTTETTYDDPDGKLKKAVDDAQGVVNRIKGERNTAASNLATANENLTKTEENINGYTVTKGENGLTEQERLKKDYDDAVTAQDASEEATAVTDAEAKVAAANKALADARAAVTAAEAKLATDRESLETATTVAQAAADELANATATAAARDVYTEVTLTGDVTADAAITADYAGTIWGNGNIITNTTNSPIFTKTFTGHLNNAGINGQFAQSTTGAKFDNVARWSNTSGVYYNEDGQKTEYNNTSLGAFGFQVRDQFGVNFVADPEKSIVAGLTKLTDNTKVFDITLYPNLSAAPIQNYVTVNTSNKFISAENTEGFVIGDNRFAKSATEDLTKKFTGIANIFYGANNICDNAVITDAVSFYCPENINASKITYKRTFKAGYNTVCLPFDLEYGEDDPNISGLFTYSSEDSEKFWFKKVAEGIEANTPYLLKAKNQITNLVLSNKTTTIAKTTKQIIQLDTDVPSNSMSFGTLKTATVDEFIGSASSYKIYGYKSSDGLFHPAIATGEDPAKFPAFRMVICSNVERNSSVANAPRRIGLLDAKGIEITDDDQSGIEGVENVASSVSIAVGQGEINITSEADYGTVAIYTIDGKVAAMTDVMVGTTTVNVPKGIYIVMGQKVMVK